MLMLCYVMLFDDMFCLSYDNLYPCDVYVILCHVLYMCMLVLCYAYVIFMIMYMICVCVCLCLCARIIVRCHVMFMLCVCVSFVILWVVILCSR